MNAYFFPLARLLVVCSVVVCLAATAEAQGVRRASPIRRYQNSAAEPFVSPYLNLVRPGADPGLNYFTLVQPQLQMERNQRLQASQIRTVNQDVRQQAIAGPYGQTGGLRATGGKAASFRNYSHYYPRLGAGASVGKPARDYPSPITSGGGMFGGGMGGMGSF